MGRLSGIARADRLSVPPPGIGIRLTNAHGMGSLRRGPAYQYNLSVLVLTLLRVPRLNNVPCCGQHLAAPFPQCVLPAVFPRPRSAPFDPTTPR